MNEKIFNAVTDPRTGLDGNIVQRVVPLHKVALASIAEYEGRLWFADEWTEDFARLCQDNNWSIQLNPDEENFDHEVSVFLKYLNLMIKSVWHYAYSLDRSGDGGLDS